MTEENKARWSQETWNTALEMRPNLMRYARKLTRDQDEDVARDIVQQAYTNVAQHEATGAKEPPGIKTYMYRTVHNVAIDAYRRREIRGGMPNVHIPDSEAYEHAMGELRSDNPHPDERLYHEQMRGAVYAALADKPEFAETYRLRYEQELDPAEAAKIAQVPVGTMKSRTFRLNEFLEQTDFQARAGKGEKKAETVATR